MKKIYLFKSFRSKITIALILLLCFSGAVSNFLIYQYSAKFQFHQLREKLMIIAEAVAMSLDADTLLGIPLNREGVNSPQYSTIEKKILQIKEVAPSLAYIYVLKKTGKSGIMQFIIDVHPGTYKKDINPAVPGECYVGSGLPELMRSFAGPAADMVITTDKWGAFLSGYAPIRDREGKTVAILGIDMAANDIYQMQEDARKMMVSFFVIGIVFSVILGMFISAKVTAPIKKLVEGTRHISSGDLQHKVDVKGADEISELAAGFNKMAVNLYKARQKLFNYFYLVVQSLVRVLEARDPYTKGHSDRVVEYSEAIATELGLPDDKIEVLKEAALLHDIGKLGVQEMLLNKKIALTNEDRQAIERHPVIGEDILKPISREKEMLSVIRGHHERYDGTGYPDRLKGDVINILAAIVTVADSYDAMTSHRAYRKNLTKAEAIEQLKANSGLQFNPKVVDAFVKILKEEDDKK